MNITKEDVGKKVWSILEGWGYIKKFTNAGVENQVWVLFENKEEGWFHPNGKRWKSQVNAEIYWDKIKFEEPPKPKPKEKEGPFYIHKFWTKFKWKSEYQMATILTKDSYEEYTKNLSECDFIPTKYVDVEVKGECHTVMMW